MCSQSSINNMRSPSSGQLEKVIKAGFDYSGGMSSIHTGDVNKRSLPFRLASRDATKVSYLY